MGKICGAGDYEIKGARCLCDELWAISKAPSADEKQRTFALTFPNVSVLSTNKNRVVCFLLKRKETTMTGGLIYIIDNVNFLPSLNRRITGIYYRGIFISFLKL